jgi:hypothetical protein
MAYANPQDHPPVSGIRNQSGVLRAKIRMPQIDVRHPASNHYGSCHCTHKLDRPEHVTIEFGGKDAVESCIFRLTRHRLDFRGSPSDARNDPKS